VIEKREGVESLFERELDFIGVIGLDGDVIDGYGEAFRNPEDTVKIIGERILIDGDGHKGFESVFKVAFHGSVGTGAGLGVWEEIGFKEGIRGALHAGIGIRFIFIGTDTFPEDERILGVVRKQFFVLPVEDGELCSRSVDLLTDAEDEAIIGLVSKQDFVEIGVIESREDGVSP
jgi:hypothetical protein